MNPSPAKRFLAMLLVVLVVPITVSPGADAYHLADAAGLPESPPSLPEDVWNDTGIVPIDRVGDDAEGAVRVGNGTVDSRYTVVRGRAQEAEESATDDLPMQPLHLLRDGAGGRDASEPDRLWGGFGEWQVLGDSAWGDRAEAARTGDVGYTQATEPGGTYRPNAMSLFLSPEIDLDTNFFHDDRNNWEMQEGYASASDLVGGALPSDPPPTQPEYAQPHSALATFCRAMSDQVLEVFAGSGTFQLICDAYHQGLGADPAYSLRYDLRYNMPTQGNVGIDGVVVLVFEGAPPDSIDDVEGCALTPPPPIGSTNPGIVSVGASAERTTACTVATPAEGGYPVNNVTALPTGTTHSLSGSNSADGLSTFNTLRNPNYPGYAGFSDWTTHTIDLAPWENRSVWVGFLFGSSSFPLQSYFGSSTQFNQQAGFYGFQMDNLRIDALAAPYNLKSRVPTEPSFIPALREDQVRGFPVIAPETVFTARAEVVNLGTARVDVDAVVRIMELEEQDVDGNLTLVLNATTGAPYEFRVTGASLGPGDVLEMTPAFAGLPSGVNYVVHVCSERGGSGGDDGFCDRGPGGVPTATACSRDTRDADRCDEVKVHQFHVREARGLRVDSIQRGTDLLRSGDTTSMSVVLHNLGNVERTLDVRPRIVTLTNGGAVIADDDQSMLHRIINGSLDPSPTQPVMITLGPGESAGPDPNTFDVHLPAWEVRGIDPGQYRLMVDAVTAGSPFPGFHPQDALPAMLQPWRSGSMQSGINADGIINGPQDGLEWLEYAQSGHLSGDTLYYLGNTVGASGGDILAFALEGSPAERIEVRFADRDSKGELRDGVETGYVVDGDGVRPVVFDAASNRWEEGTAVDSAATGARRDRGDGIYDYELQIPIGVGASEDGLAAGPGGTVNLLLRQCLDAPTPVGYVCDPEEHTPFGAPLEDGDGFLAADGSLDDETANWLPVLIGDGNPTAGYMFERQVSAGFAVGTSPPSLLDLDLATPGAGCPSFLGWATTATRVVDKMDKWNCAPHIDAGGRVLLYQGLSPDSACDGEACLPYASLGGAPRVMHTAPFQIPLDAGAPTVTLAHQYSTKAVIDDINQVVLHQSLPQLYLEAWNEETGRFEEVARLTPDAANGRSYPTPDQVGVGDDRFTRTYLPPGTPWASPLPQFGVFTQPQGWWWPQGDQRLFQPAESSFAAGDSFVGGSPWVTDTLALYGDHLGKAVDVAGQTVRLRFDHPFDAYPQQGDMHMNGKSGNGAGGGGDPLFLSGGHPVLRVAGVPLISTTSGEIVSGFLDNPTLPLSDARPFTAVCVADPPPVGSGPDDRYILLSVHRKGCEGNVTAFDVILPGSSVDGRNTITGGSSDHNSMNYIWLTTGLHDRMETTGVSGNGAFGKGRADVAPVVGRDYDSTLSDDLVIDWVDQDGDGRYSHLDTLYLNLGGTRTVQPGDIRLGGPGSGPAPDVGATYCGTSKCSPTASTADVQDIVFADRDGNRRWSPPANFAIQDFHGDYKTQACTGGQNEAQCVDGKKQLPSEGDLDRAFLPGHLLNGERHPVRDRDWGWRIGGITVTDGDRFARDVAVQSARLQVPDGAVLGPGMEVPVEVSLVNRGEEPALVTVGVAGEDTLTQTPACSGERRNIQVAAAGATVDVTVECPLEDVLTEGRIAFHAHVRLPGVGEDIVGNNLQRVRGFYDMEARPDAAVSALRASPRDAESGVPRDLLISVQNTGNVPVPDAWVEVSVTRSTADGPVDVILPRNLTLRPGSQGNALEVGQTRTLFPNNLVDATTADLSVTPELQGTYTLSARVIVPGDVDDDNDRSDDTLRVLTTFYQTFKGNDATTTLPGVIEGNLVIDDGSGVWRIAGNSHDGTERLLAGDPEKGEIPMGTDASIHLPTIHLEQAKDATLRFKHRYDLEEHFDGGRVEASTDGGKTWSPIFPKPAPENGLADGYPSTRFLGSPEFLDGAAECTACAFTGRSGDLPGADNGWLEAEFDLTDQRQFLAPADIAGFSLDGLATHPLPVPLERDRIGGPSDLQFIHLATNKQEPDGAAWQEGDIDATSPTSPHWGVDDTDWFQNEQYWWIDNLTHSQPAPRFGQTMWWSGSAGVAMADEQQPEVNTSLSLDLDASLWENTEAQTEIVLSWWDWRAGWRDGSEREGTGGIFDVQTPPGASQVRIAERRDDGWTRREVVLPTAAQDLAVAFQYVSGEALPETIEYRPYCDHCQQGNHPIVPISQIENDLGWFIEGAELLQRGPNGDTSLKAFDLQDITMDPTGAAGDWTSHVLEGSTAWSLAERGAAARDGGWHLDELDFNQRKTLAWRFASDDPEGYPASANSRLVTPRVDLRDYSEDTATIRFDHKYKFHGHQEGREVGFDSQRLSQDALAHGVDAGTVLYQVYDDVKGTYGAWRPLTAAPIGDATVSHAFHPLIDPDGEGSPALNSKEAAVPEGFSDLGYPGVNSMPPDRTDFTSVWGRGLGTDLPSVTGHYFANYLPGGNGALPVTPAWTEYPFAYVFTGTQEEWTTEEWDISPLIGQEVRFGFQAWTNPSDHPCRAEGNPGPSFVYLDTEPDDPWGRCSSDPEYDDSMRGWSITNLGIAGQAFQGAPVDIRLRLVTDGSDPKGEWSVDDITVVGTRYEEAVRVETPTLSPLAGQDTDIFIDGTIKNLGVRERSDLAIAVTAVDALVPTPPEARLLTPSLAAVNSAGLPLGVDDAVGAFSLEPGGLDGDAVPFRIGLSTPDYATNLTVRMLLLEKRCPTCGFTPIENEAGSPETSWRIAVEDRLDLQIIPPIDTEETDLVVSPLRPRTGEPVSVTTRALNQGTLEPATTVQWTVKEIDRKGGQAQREVDEEKSRVIDELTTPLGVIHRDETRDATLDFVPPRDGLYRATLDLIVGGDTVATKSVEFIVGDPSPYYDIDFAMDNATQSGWESVAPGLDGTGNGGTGGTPNQIRFRQVDGSYLWGVTDQQFSDGQTYCSFGGCNFGNEASGSGGAQQDWYGLLGQAVDGDRFVDLGKVPGDSATLLLEHSHSFDPQAGDGGRVEVRPLRSPVEGSARSAFECANGGGQRTDMWFVLVPRSNTSQHAFVLSAEAFDTNQFDPSLSSGARVNPLNDQETTPWRFAARRLPAELLPGTIPHFGGDPVQREIVAYDLSQPPIPVCPKGFEVPETLQDELDTLTLINYTVQVRLSSGTLPGFTWPCDHRSNSSNGLQGFESFCRNNGEADRQGNTNGRDGGQGWRIHSLYATSLGIDIEQDRAELPVREGFPKRFQYTITNSGNIPATFAVEVDRQRSSPPSSGFDASWLDFPQEQVELGPGQSVPFTFHVTVPSGTDPATYAAVLRMASVTQPNVRDTIRLDLRLDEQPLPDLIVGLSAEGAALVPELEQDTVAVLSVPVRNIGTKESDRVDLVLEVEHDNQTSLITRRSIDPLCPAQECGPVASQEPITVEWRVPHRVGEYILHARVDPQERLVELSKAQNNASMIVHVVPLQRPDVAITGLDFLGVADDGYALEGDLVRIVANVTNVGVEPASQVTVRILSGGATLWTETIQTLAPSETRQVNASRFATRGESLVQAVATLNQDPVTSNNAMGRLLRTRGVDLQLAPQDDAPLQLVPGGTGTALVNVTNLGNVVERITLDLDPIHAGWGIAASPHPLQVAANSTSWTTVTLRAPDDATAGLHPIRVVGAPLSRPQAGTATVLQILVAAAGDAPSMTLEEDSVLGDVTARLVSHRNADEHLRLHLVEPADWSLAPTTVTLPAKATVQTVLDLSAPATTLPGPVSVRLQAIDAAGQVRTEVRATVQVPTVVDAEAMWAGDGRLPSPDDLSVQVHEFRLEVTNLGNVPFRPDPVAVALNNGSSQLDLKEAPTLGPGETATVAVHIQTAVERVEDLRGRIEVWARAGNDTPEQPVAVLDIPSRYRPDLVVEQVRLSPRGEVQVGEPVRIVATVANRGALPMEPSRMYAYVNGDLVHVLPVGAIPVGEEVQVNVTWSFTQAGSHLVHLQGNGDADQEEAHVDNNGQNVVIEVRESPVSRFLDDVVDVPGPAIPVLLLVLAAVLVARRRYGGGA